MKEYSAITDINYNKPVKGILKLNIEATKASSAPPVAPL
jgi:ribosomal protein L11